MHMWRQIRFTYQNVTVVARKAIPVFDWQAVSSIHEPVLVLGHEIESEAEVCQLGESV